MNRRCGSSSIVPALQAWSPEFKLQYHQKIEKKKKKEMRRGKKAKG
jgi:hypothetical protein